MEDVELGVFRVSAVQCIVFHISCNLTSQRVYTSTKNATEAHKRQFATDPEARLLLTRTIETLQKLYMTQEEMAFAPPAFCESDELCPFEAVPLLGV